MSNLKVFWKKETGIGCDNKRHTTYVFFCLLAVLIESFVFGLAHMLLGPGEILLEENKVLRLIEC